MKRLIAFALGVIIVGVLSAQTPNSFRYPVTIGMGAPGTVTGGSLILKGLTSGTATISVPAVAGTGTIFQLPATNGTNTNVLTTNGSGVLSWSAAGSGTLVAHDTTHLSDRINLKVNLADSTGSATGTYVSGKDFVVGQALKVNIADSTGGAANTYTSGKDFQVLNNIVNAFEMDSAFLMGTNIVFRHGNDSLNPYIPYASRENGANIYVELADSANGTGAAGKYVTGKDFNTTIADYTLKSDSANGTGAAGKYVTGKDFNTDMAAKADKYLTDTLLLSAAGSYRLKVTDAGRTIRANSATQIRIYLPPDSTAAIPIGSVFNIKNDGTGIVRFMEGTGVRSDSKSDSSALNKQHEWATLIKRTALIWDLLGDLQD